MRTRDDTPTLLVSGALAGALAGVMTAAILLLPATLTLRNFPVEALVFGAEVGFPFGAVLLPLAMRLAIPQVPLGRATLSVIAGTTIGAALSSRLAFSLAEIISGGIAGFVLAVVALSWSSERESRHSESGAGSR
jgi:hypothetical protein